MPKISDKNIIFLFSLPRSGSTLLQRSIGVHPSVHTASETWLLLSQLHWFEDNLSYSAFDYATTRRAIIEFSRNLNDGTDKYKQCISHFILDCYQECMGENANEKMFLEKTPRNCLILEQIYSMFPNSKFIYLWRNPVSIASSIVETFGEGKWKIKNYEIDLFKNYEHMISGYKKYSEISHSVRYEDLVQKPEKTLNSIFKYLELNQIDTKNMDLNKTMLNGTLGDKSGINSYSTISGESVDKWKGTVVNPLRKQWMKKYIKWIGSENIELMGYTMLDIINDIDDHKTTNKMLLSDSLRSIYYYLNTIFNLQVAYNNYQQIITGKKIYPLR
jgi:hypothetical protein